MELAKRQCVPCSGNTPRLSGEQLARFFSELGGDWELAGPAESASESRVVPTENRPVRSSGPTENQPDQSSGGDRLRKTFRFRDFASALAFVNRIGAVAEREQHHPDIKLGWGLVSVEIWTHAIGGLSENDFILAAKIDEVAV